ncbi:PEP synthetase regulatory protein [Lentilactobacillus parabuchneri]|nr:PEP synthetase regulatory protein [Lentilactobacillus parabuchneri]
MKTQNIFIISDSSGATAQTIAQTALSQFPDVKAEIRRFPFIQTESILKGSFTPWSALNSVRWSAISAGKTAFTTLTAFKPQCGCWQKLPASNRLTSLV